MNAVKRQRPSISPDDVQRLLFHLEDARNYITKFGSAQSFDSQARAVAENARQAIDDLAGQITGDVHFLWGPDATAGGSSKEFQRGVEREAQRRRLMGVRIPVRAMRLPMVLG